MPGRPTAAGATGRGSAVAVSGPTVPFIVDWKPEERGDLEEAVGDGVAVVAFDGRGLRLLKRCRLRGDYGYLPLEPKRDVIRFGSARELQANLPVGGAGLALKIGGGFEQGKTLDLAYVMIGKRRTTWSDPTFDDVQGKCEGATHYVRAMTIGAFAMSTGAREKVQAFADVFAVRAGASSSTSGDVTSTDGDLGACMSATLDGDKPPAGCRSLLRLELEPIGAAAPKSAPEDAAGAPAVRVETKAAVDCGPGMAFTDGKCTVLAASEARPRVCNLDDLVDCDAQCRKGDATSCDQAGYLVATGKAGRVDDALADAYFERACNGDSANACVNLGIRRLFGTPGRAPSTSGLTLLDKACRQGEPRGCTVVADALWQGIAGAPKKLAVAVRYYTLGCNGGDAHACTNLGTLYMGAGGPEVPIDEKKSLDLSVRACNGGISTACGNTGLRYEFGMGVPRNVPQAEALFRRACQLDDADCIRLGILYQHGVGAKRDDRAAKALFEKSCGAVGVDGTSGFPSLACYVNAKVYGATSGKLDPSGLAQTLSVMKPQCDADIARACTFYAVSAYALRRPAEAAPMMKRGCALGDPWACDLDKRMKN